MLSPRRRWCVLIRLTERASFRIKNTGSATTAATRPTASSGTTRGITATSVRIKIGNERGASAVTRIPVPTPHFEASSTISARDRALVSAFMTAREDDRLELRPRSVSS